MPNNKKDAVCIRCVMKLDVPGPDRETAVAWTAKALRIIADGLEADQFTVGGHDISDKARTSLGHVYFGISNESSDEKRRT